MSLLNDMLKDLSHQQKPVETVATANTNALDFNAQEQRELFYHTSAAKPLPRTWMPSIIIFIVVLMVLALWKSKFFNESTGTTIVSPATENVMTQLEMANQSPSEPIIAVQAAADVNPVITQAVPIDGSVNTNEIAPELGERIAALESAITHLSVVVANANTLAANDVTDYEADTDDDMGAEALVRDDEYSVQIAEQDSAIESVSIREPFASDMADTVAEPVIENGEPQLSIAPNGKWKDQQQAQQANQLAAQGQTDVAVEKLQHFIATAEQPRESVKALLGIFADQENTGAMQTLLASANYLPVVEQTFYAAKIAVIQQQDAQAIQLLETHLGEAESDENYRALLAGLYQRTGMHVEAANHYRRLLGVFGDKPAYWLGFALAQDALDQPQVAVQAYQRVNHYTDLQPEVRTYVQQRIAVLQQ